MELLDGHFTRISSKIKLCSIDTCSKFPWCSGYHICLTRRRSLVRSRTETYFDPLYVKKFLVSDFSQNLYKHPPRSPDKRTYIRFWNKSLLKSYRNFYIFGFLTVRNYPWFFFTAESLSLAEFESVGILEISWSVLKILAKQFSFF